ncbi:MAG TPA: tRNA (guanosine(46)-N7)-methyltransferase TrmB [Verrucomicrobiae bacterium]|nr:tRNA (guanosine(46)-N7)-methyltransferase TrmB [Verrucomicrobiae bacterium]
MASRTPVNPEDFIITRKRKKYKFALFHNSPVCFELDEWDGSYVPSVIEIGAGTGLFSVEQAAGHPEGAFLAVDVKADRLQKGAASAVGQGLANMRFLRSRADQLPEVVPAHSADIIWVTFPDPFPKKHSAGRRLTHPTFLKVYRRLLKEDGALYFKTDAHALFEWSLEQLVAEGWTIKELSFDLHESDLAEWYKVKTNYETRFINEGLMIHFVKAIPPKEG